MMIVLTSMAITAKLSSMAPSTAKPPVSSSSEVAASSLVSCTSTSEDGATLRYAVRTASTRPVGSVPGWAATR